MNTSPFTLLVLQATSKCNINCKYCYLSSKDRSSKAKFDLDLIPIIMENLKASNLLGSSFHISWHAGEPTVLKPSFYTKAVKAFEKANHTKVSIEHSIQTNATLLTEEYCQIIKECNIAVSVSIDGPEFINDLNRIMLNGKGTFNKAMRGINLLNKYKIPFSTISVVSEKSLDYPEEIFFFLKNIGSKSIAFNVEEIEGVNSVSSISIHHLNKYEKFLGKVTSLIKNSGSKMRQREYVHAIERIIKSDSDPKNGLVTPMSTITIDTHGNYTAFSPELLTTRNSIHGDYIFGNVKDRLFSDAIASKKLKSILKEINAGVELCQKECDFFSVCGGGSPSNKLHENGSFNSTETNYCKYAVQIPIKVVIDDISTLQSK